MKPSDNDIKKAFEQMDIPEPSGSAKDKAVQEALQEFAKKNARIEKKSQGFLAFIRRMGTTLQKITTVKGEPIMTQRQFATVGILVIAVGLVVSIGPQVLHQSQTTKAPQPPITTDSSELEETAQGKPAIPTQNNETAESASPVEQRARQNEKDNVGHVTKAPEPQSREITGARVRKEEKPAAGSPSAAAPMAKKKIGGKAMMMDMSTSSIPGRLAIEGESSIDAPVPGYYKDEGRDKFTEIKINPIKLVKDEPVSTFSIDVDTASYAFVRRQLNNGVLPQKDAVRVEELINYFNYDYQMPEDRSKPFKPTVALYPSPWNNNTKLLHIGIKGYDKVASVKPRANLVFLLDVSGSMNSPDKLPLLKNSFSMLVDSMDPEDTVAIAVYAGAAGTVLEPTNVKEKGKILAALNKLQAGGSTAGGQGIHLAYTLAEMNFDKDAVNRVILATDGDFNVGIANQNELQSFIERKRKTGIFLSVLGFGQGNYNDALMQALAQNGNGNAAYIDNLNEARKVLVDEAGSTLFTIAKDVKIQIEFNPDKIHDYRLIGYETRMLKQEDFNNDRVDAGDVGSGHSVTAIYEITPLESKEKLIDDLRYQKAAPKQKVAPSNEYAFLKIRYKLPKEDTSNLLTMPITQEQDFASIEKTPLDMRFAASVAAFGQVLRNGSYTGEFGYDDIIRLAEPARGRDRFGYRSEFVNLVRLAKTARGM